MALRRRIQIAGLLAGPLAAAATFAWVPDSYGADGDLRVLGQAGRAAAAVAVWMAVWWLTEAIPIFATALVPALAWPLLGVLPLAEATRPYAHPLIFLFMGGFLISLAMERWQLHRRIALGILARAGASPGRVVGGFMAVTAGLSMWVSNTATTIMMLPIALSVVTQVGSGMPRQHRDRLALCLLLGIAYSASIGGIATIIGTPPNLFLVSYLSEVFGEDISFARWMLIGLPLVLVFLPLCWWLLTRWIYPLPPAPGGAGAAAGSSPGGAGLLQGDGAVAGGSSSVAGGPSPVAGGPSSGAGGPSPGAGGSSSGASAVGAQLGCAMGGAGAGLADLRRALGPMSLGERMTLGVFLLAVLGWVFRGLWVELEILGHRPLAGLTDTGVAMLAGLLLFLLPADPRAGTFVMDWDTAKRLPWGILILFGGGLSLAAGLEAAGVGPWLGHQVGGLQALAPWLIVLAVCALVIFLTELSTNIAVTAAMVPILAAMAPGLGVHPYSLVFTAALAASCAFMMPIATAPNAIVFSSGHITIAQMCRAGLVLNLAGIVLITALMYLLALPLLGISAGLSGP